MGALPRHLPRGAGGLPMRLILLGGAAALTLLATGSATAQTANDNNRLNAAIQICNSPAGAGLAECAKLRGQLGLSGGGSGGQGGGGAMGAVGGLLGALNAARAAPTPVASSQVNTAAVQQGVAACVRNAAGDAAAIQACLSSAAAVPAARPGLGIGAYQAPATASAGDAALAIHQAGQSYQACAAANPPTGDPACPS